MTDMIGANLGRYHILEQLGEGGMATVYKAYDTRLEREVAVKIIRREVFGSAMMDRVLKRFDREAKTLAKMTHANIVSVIDYGDYEGAPYLVLVYLPGKTLKSRLGAPMPYAGAARLLKPIADALDYAHQHGIVHRDVKPGNILFTESGTPMLTDFGITKILEDEDGQTLTGTGIGVGTPEYMAPEQAQGREVDGRADVYALGVVFYELVTGRKPYTADTPMAVIIKQATDPLPRPRQYVPDLPDRVEQVLFKALAKKPEDRYQSMAEFAAALGGLAVGTAVKYAIATSNEKGNSTSLVKMDRMVDTSESPTTDGVLTRDVKKIKHTVKRLPWIIAGSIVFLLIIAVLIIQANRGAIMTDPSVISVESVVPTAINTPSPVVPTAIIIPTLAYVPITNNRRAYMDIFHGINSQYENWDPIWKKYGYVTDKGALRLDQVSLDQYSVLILYVPSPNYGGGGGRFTNQEIEAVINYVKGGGQLFLIAEHRFDPASTGAANQISTILGVQFNDDDLPDQLVYPNTNNPITTDLDSWRFSDLASSINIQGTNAFPVLSTKDGNIILAISNYGNGRAVFLGDFEGIGMEDTLLGRIVKWLTL
jgi:serine/threonine protein kinase